MIARFIFGNVNGLRRAYNLAVAQGLSYFKYEGQDFDTSYAKYLLEYLEGKARV